MKVWFILWHKREALCTLVLALPALAGTPQHLLPVIDLLGF